MRILITGLNGTLAPKLAARAQGHEIIGWDRSAVPPGDAGAGAAMLAAARPDAIAHLGFGAEAWAAQMAAHAAAHRLPFLFTSTAMVFHHEPDGPHRVGDACNAQDDYGRYKIRCEDAIRAVAPDACIARIGWQIDPDGHGNNMLAALDGWQARDGCVRASTRWRPACSFMTDTAQALLHLLEQAARGTIHLDSNAARGYTFERIARALAAQFGRRHWRVESTDDYVHDQRLAGPGAAGETLLPPLDLALPALGPT